MNPDLLLRVLAALVGFFLKTTLAFGVCLLFSRLVDSPSRRFGIWLSFLFGAGMYWLWLAQGVIAGGQSLASAPVRSLQPAPSSVGAWQIPGSWVSPLGVALRVAGIVYLLVLGFILFSHIKKQWRLKWVIRFTGIPPVEIADTFRSLAHSLRVSRSRLLVLSGIAPHSPQRLCLEQFCCHVASTFVLSSCVLVRGPDDGTGPRARMRSCRCLSDSGKKSVVCGVLNSLRAIESIRRSHDLGRRLRGISTFEGSRSLDPGRIKEVLRLVPLPTHGLWTYPSYWFSRNRTIAGRSHFLRADVTTNQSGNFGFAGDED